MNAAMPEGTLDTPWTQLDKLLGPVCRYCGKLMEGSL